MPVRSRTSRSTAVFSPLKLKSTRRATSGGSRPSLVGLRRVPIRVRQPRRREVARPIVAVAREPIDHRPARIPEPEQLRHLVVRLSRRIVARAADQAVGAGLGDQIQAGVAAGHDEHGRRQRQLAVCEDERLDVAGEMMHGHDRDAARPGERLRERDADEQRADQARAPASPPRRRDRPSTRPPRPAPLRPRRRCRARAAATPAPARRRPTRGGSPPATRRCSSGSPRGGAGSPVSATSAAAVSSQDVSIASRFRRRASIGALQRSRMYGRARRCPSR